MNETGESGETYDLEMLSDSMNAYIRRTLKPKGDDAKKQGDDVPQRLQESIVSQAIPVPVCDEEILLERVLRPRGESKKTPYGSPYHRTIYAKNYRKDLDRKVIVGEEPLEDANERAKSK